MASQKEDQLLGEKVAALCLMRLVPMDNVGDSLVTTDVRYTTIEGTKTALGIGRTIRRLIQEAKTEKFTSATYVEE